MSIERKEWGGGGGGESEREREREGGGREVRERRKAKGEAKMRAWQESEWALTSPRNIIHQGHVKGGK
jgi:hypothetical protein